MSFAAVVVGSKLKRHSNLQAALKSARKNPSSFAASTSWGFTSLACGVNSSNRRMWTCLSGGVAEFPELTRDPCADQKVTSTRNTFLPRRTIQATRSGCGNSGPHRTSS